MLKYQTCRFLAVSLGRDDICPRTLGITRGCKWVHMDAWVTVIFDHHPKSR